MRLWNHDACDQRLREAQQAAEQIRLSQAAHVTWLQGRVEALEARLAELLEPGINRRLELPRRREPEEPRVSLGPKKPKLAPLPGYEPVSDEESA